MNGLVRMTQDCFNYHLKRLQQALRYLIAIPSYTKGRLCARRSKADRDRQLKGFVNILRAIPLLNQERSTVRTRNLPLVSHQSKSRRSASENHRTGHKNVQKGYPLTNCLVYGDLSSIATHIISASSRLGEQSWTQISSWQADPQKHMDLVPR